MKRNRTKTAGLTDVHGMRKGELGNPTVGGGFGGGGAGDRRQ